MCGLELEFRLQNVTCCKLMSGDKKIFLFRIVTNHDYKNTKIILHDKFIVFLMTL